MGGGRAPTLVVERESWDGGAEVVCGVDEVGRGAWAGPVSVAALVVPRGPGIDEVRDSKELTRSAREQLHDRILAWAPAVGVGHAWPHECDALGMTAATRRAAWRALARLAAADHEPDRILLDGKHDYLGEPGRVRTIVGGDGSSLAIAAASVVAKVTRDAMMRSSAHQYPGFGFESNVGYPSPVHRAALNAYGPTAVHRRSWVFMRSLPWFRDRAALDAAGVQAEMFPTALR